jgi:transcriptional regulator with XRE-family HTH domain
MAKRVPFAMRVRSLRKARGFTQDEVVAGLSEKGFPISKSGYQKWEKTGGLKKHPDLVALSALAELFEVPVHVIVDFDFQKNEELFPGALEHFVDIDLLAPDKIELLKNMYDNFQKDARKEKTSKGDVENE